jgi:hypothetical protein
MSEQIENSIIDTEKASGWDGDLEYVQFYDAPLKVQIGEHKPGTVIPVVVFCNMKSVVQLYFGTDSKCEEYKMSIQIGDRVN